MANTKISALTSAATPLAGTEVLPIVQSGATVKVAANDLTVRNVRANATTGILQVTGPAAASTRVVTVPDANWTAARTDAAQSFTGNQTLATGNIVQGTAAKGINFTANTPAAGMTSQLLNWYEEGTFTPTLVSAGGAVTYNVQSGSYTRIGNLVTFNLYINFNIATATGVLSVAFGALPAQKTGTTASNWPVLFSRGFIFPANKTALYIYKNTGSVNAALRWQDITGAAGTATDATALTAAFGAPEFMVSGSYLTN